MMFTPRTNRFLFERLVELYMGSLLDRIRSSLGLVDKNDIGCRAVIDEESGEVCGNAVWGRGCVDGYEVKYCRKDNHVPSNATPWSGGLVDPLTFYIPEDDELIEVK